MANPLPPSLMVTFGLAPLPHRLWSHFDCQVLAAPPKNDVINNWPLTSQKVLFHHLFGFLQYDQGEDRWLCTLLLQRGWRIEYSAASDAYTGNGFLDMESYMKSTVALELLPTPYSFQRVPRASVSFSTRGVGGCHRPSPTSSIS